ncbi:MAG: autotransporter-associated beta strand repeat-containing protein, partial [Planctomycetota bacterium]
MAIAGLASVWSATSSPAATYTWLDSNVSGTPSATLDWFNAPQGAWGGGTPVSNGASTIQFFTSATTTLGNTTSGTQSSVIDNGGTAFQLGTLTLSGKGSGTAGRSLVLSVSGDPLNFSATTGTISLDATNGASNLSYVIGSAIQLGTAGSSGALTIGGNGDAAFTLSGPISELQAGGGSLRKTGNSTVLLTGSNTYTGATAVNGGVLGLDFSDSGAPTSNILSVSSALSVGGGTLVLTGRANTTNSQAFNGFSVTAGQSAIMLGAGSNNPLALSLGAISRSVGGTVDFTLPQGAQSGSNGILTSSANSSGILGGWATVGGINWATVTSASNIVAYTAYTSDTWAAGNNTTITVTSSPTSGSTTNSLRFNANVAPIVTLTGVNTITSGGILMGLLTNNNLLTITSGTLRGSAGGDLNVVQTQSANNIAIVSTIADNTSATGLTKSGPGILTLSSSNTYTGVTTLNAGNLILGNDGALGTGRFVINGGQFDVNAARTITTNNLQTWNGDFTFVGSNTLNTGSGAITLAGSRVVQINSQSITVGGTIGDGGLGYGLTKSGAGTLILTGSNTYTGPTTVNNGLLRLDFSPATATATNLISSTAGLVLGGGTFNLNGKASTINSQTVAGLTLNAGPSAITLTNQSTANPLLL